jgi:hypothetical protein
MISGIGLKAFTNTKKNGITNASERINPAVKIIDLANDARLFMDTFLLIAEPPYAC